MMMSPRWFELKRVLKPTGSIYLHCDPTASHYLKLVMDGIFGSGNFRNEIAVRDIWADMDPINAAAQERIGFPTHKPLALLDRSIKEMGGIQHVEMDHIIPGATGDQDWVDNFQLLCANCNRIKGRGSQEAARAKIAKYMGMNFAVFE